MYKKLAGMTGTADTEAEEFAKIYKLDVVVIPTNQPIVRNDFEDVVYKTEREKFNAVCDEIEERHEQGPAGPRRHGHRREDRGASRRCSRSTASRTTS